MFLFIIVVATGALAAAAALGPMATSALIAGGAAAIRIAVTVVELGVTLKTVLGCLDLCMHVSFHLVFASCVHFLAMRSYTHWSTL